MRYWPIICSLSIVARIVYPGAKMFLPQMHNLPVLRESVQRCQGCDLYANATQAVFGEGKRESPIMLVGEQPGNDEDLQGRPFVGPAGKILDRALDDAGIARDTLYVTNAVKHFKFEERGERRIHKKPNTAEVRACEPWLEAEVAAARPQVIVCLGATAAQSLYGTKFRFSEHRGRPLDHPWARHVLATVHPSAILRIPDTADRHAEYQRFVADLKHAQKLL